MTREEAQIAVRKMAELIKRAESLIAGIDQRLRRIDAEIAEAQSHLQALIDVQREKRRGRGHEQSRRKARRADKVT